MPDKPKHRHAGHRERMKAEFLARGLEGWPDHRVLELLLFYAIPQGDDEAGYAALVNAKRAAFIVDMLGHAVGDECVNLLTHILDHVHYDVMEYLGETEDA